MKSHGIVDSGDAEKLGIGAMTDQRMKAFFDQMVVPACSNRISTIVRPIRRNSSITASGSISGRRK